MSPQSADSPTVLVVDDETNVADVYAVGLEEKYNVRTAYSGQAAIEAIDNDVDVLLLDRRMPRLSGDEVLETIRADGYDCRVIMVTAIEPEFDIVEMPFDDYLCKPVDQETLQQAIESQLTAKKYDETVRELFRATSKVALLEAKKTGDELDNSEEYQQLKQTAKETRKTANSLISKLDDFESAFKAIDRSAD